MRNLLNVFLAFGELKGGHLPQYNLRAFAPKDAKPGISCLYCVPQEGLLYDKVERLTGMVKRATTCHRALCS
jgi:hypothetical protein